MTHFLKVATAGAMVFASTFSAMPQAYAHSRHHHAYDQAYAQGNDADYQRACMERDHDVAVPLLLGLVLGGVTGGVGSAVAFGSAYAVGGAAVGGAAGLVIGASADAHGYHC